ncbi:MAG TPA: thioredoxin domain-containing protein [Prolixibacteraceae bacterium]|nr:thioredoxin domain-containing protein [Prolixibacteraceae bacterium]
MKKQIIPMLLFVLSMPLLLSAGQNASSSTQTATQKLTKADFLEKVMDYEKNPTEWVFKGSKPCLIDFYADWCGPCRITSPILEELAQEYKGKIDVYKVNVDNERELSQVFGISGIPAFLYCPLDGKPSMTSGIARDKEQTKQMFRNNIETLLLKTK